MKWLAWLRFQFDRLSYRFEGHWPHDYTDCPLDCANCLRVIRRNDRMCRYLAARTLPQARSLL